MYKTRYIKADCDIGYEVGQNVDIKHLSILLFIYFSLTSFHF